MTLEEYQADLRRSYVGGGVGAVVSGIVWAVAAFVEASAGVGAGFTALFFGGMLIFVVSTAICRVVFRRAGTAKGNPGGMLVVETLPGMFLGLFAAFLFIESRPELVFPIAAIGVGAHYFPFRTAYGDFLYWVLGGAMMAVGAVAITGFATIPFGTAAAIAAVEIVFGIVLVARNLGSGRE